MKIIVGLGNPGRKYERTRHNAGFLAINEIAESLHAEVSQEKYHALFGRARSDSEEIILAKPQTYMNDSGRAVAAILRGTYTNAADLIVIHDELDLPLGAVRVKTGGGHGGHNGLRSLIEHLGSADFIRVRIGIGRPEPGRDAADYVLSPFLSAERQTADEAVKQAAKAALAVVSQGVTKAMNLINQK